MSSYNQHSEVKLMHGEYVARIKNYGQKDWIRACEKLSLCVRSDYGKGAHAVAYSSEILPPTSDMVVLTIPSNLYSAIQRDFVKKVVGYGARSERYTELDVWKALNIIVK